MASTDLFTVLDSVPTPIFVLDVTADDDPVYAYCNRTTLERTKRPLSEFVGRTTVEAYGAHYGNAALEEQRQTILSRSQRTYEFELPIDNSLRIVRTTLCPLFDAEGSVYQLIGSSQDVSAEWIAQRARSKLEAIGSEVEQFVAMAAHDLRAPMRNVSMLAEMLRENFEDHGDGELELIDLLEETSQKSMALITDVLSHACAVSTPEARERFDLADLVSDLMRVLDPHRNHDLVCARVSLLGEKPTLQIILRNLIENAIKYGKRENLKLECSARVMGDSWVEITIGDNGAGFANPGNVFLDTGEFRMDSGYGMLGIRRLITARGGTITASNCEEGDGSTVRFTLPMNARANLTNGTPHLRVSENSIRLKQSRYQAN